MFVFATAITSTGLVGLELVVRQVVMRFGTSATSSVLPVVGCVGRTSIKSLVSVIGNLFSFTMFITNLLVPFVAIGVSVKFLVTTGGIGGTNQKSSVKFELSSMVVSTIGPVPHTSIVGSALFERVITGLVKPWDESSVTTSVQSSS